MLKRVDPHGLMSRPTTDSGYYFFSRTSSSGADHG
jgi:hypothetical protein